MKFKIKNMTMKTLKTIPVMLLAAALLSCEKSGPENPDPVVPPVPEENTLEVDKTDISLCYLERDTINVPGVDAADVQWSIAEGGDGIITLLGNVVVGRRKGEATVVASYNGESAAIKVTVTTEEYIPVEKLIWEINGQRVESVDDENTTVSVAVPLEYGMNQATGVWIWPLYTFPENAPKIPRGEKLEVKFIDYEPKNATYPVLSKIGGGVDSSTEEIEGSENGYLKNLESFTVVPENFLMTGGGDSRGEMQFVYYMYQFPPDLQPTSYDIDQLSATYRSQNSEIEYRSANKFLCFEYLQPNIEVKGEERVSHKRTASINGVTQEIIEVSEIICFRSGEAKAVQDVTTVIPFVPEGLEHTYSFTINDKLSRGKLHLSEDGTLALDADFSMDDVYEGVKSGECSIADYIIKGTGIMSDLETNDTLQIGYLVCSLLSEDSPYRNMVKEKYGAEYAALMTQRGDGVKIYWVKE